jgi:hypothetical protein
MRWYCCGLFVLYILVSACGGEGGPSNGEIDRLPNSPLRDVKFWTQGNNYYFTRGLAAVIYFGSLFDHEITANEVPLNNVENGSVQIIVTKSPADLVEGWPGSITEYRYQGDSIATHFDGVLEYNSGRYIFTVPKDVLDYHVSGLVFTSLYRPAEWSAPAGIDGGIAENAIPAQPRMGVGANMFDNFAAIDIYTPAPLRKVAQYSGASGIRGIWIEVREDAFDLHFVGSVITADMVNDWYSWNGINSVWAPFFVALVSD